MSHPAGIIADMPYPAAPDQVVDADSQVALARTALRRTYRAGDARHIDSGLDVPTGRTRLGRGRPRTAPPEAPRRLEIIDGVLVVMSPQTAFHARAVSAVEQGLRAAAPGDLVVMREWTVALPNRDGPEPDVVVFDRAGYHRRSL